MLPRLPLGMSAFESIREEERVYVDKTRHIYRLVTEAKFYFMSRPRRFGKSLLVSTLKCLFQGRKELFTDLWLTQNSDWKWQTHPIVLLDFNGIPHDTPENLRLGLGITLNRIAKENGLKLENTLLVSQFQELILELHHATQQPVVVLIDEYDKPLVDFLGKGEAGLAIAQANREILKTFFGVLKEADVSPALRFVFITGVSRFSRISIFSELNNLYDLSMNQHYADMLGYTQSELESYFQPHLAELAASLQLLPSELLTKLAYYYNGYRFSEKPITVYNPFSILNALAEQALKNYWFTSGTASFLVNLLQENQYDLSQIEGLQIDTSIFSNYELTYLKPEALLFQTGYLTIKAVNEELYTLDYPNQEVKTSFLKSLLISTSRLSAQMSSLVLRLAHYLRDEQLTSFFETIQAIFASIPYDIQIQRDEAYYHTIFYLMVSASGGEAQSSLLTNRGRIDLVVTFKDKIYIMEFKCNQSAEIALNQIKTQGYADKYQQSGKKLILMGLNFSTEKRNLTKWLVA